MCMKNHSYDETYGSGNMNKYTVTFSRRVYLASGKTVQTKQVSDFIFASSTRQIDLVAKNENWRRRNLLIGQKTLQHCPSKPCNCHSIQQINIQRGMCCRCVPICLSQAGIVSKPPNTESHKQCHTIARGLVL